MYMIDAKEAKKELGYLDNFEFEEPIELSYQLPQINLTLRPGMNYDEICEEFRKKVFEASREGISSMLSQCDEEIRQRRKRGSFRNVHTPESKRIASWCGEIKYSRRAYYDREGNYRHLCDEVLGLDKGQRVSIDMLLRALILVGGVSYQKVRVQIENWTGVRRAPETYRRWVLRIGEMMLEHDRKKCKAIFERPSPQPDEYGHEPDFLFLEADGCHIYVWQSESLLEQLKAEAKLKGKKKVPKGSSKKEVRLGLIYEGKRPRRGTEGNGKYEVTGKTYFGGLIEVDYFWELAAMIALERYGIGPLTQVFGSGDGAEWIGPNLEYFKEQIFSLCRFHWKREIFRMFSWDKDKGIEKAEKLITYVESDEKEQVCCFIDEEYKTCEKEGSKKKMTKVKKYLLKQWDFIQNYRKLKTILGKIDPALARVGVIEGHIYQVLYLRFESRGGCWKEGGLNCLFRILTANLNGDLEWWLRKLGWKPNINVSVSVDQEKTPNNKSGKESKCTQGSFPALQRPVSILSGGLKQIAHPERQTCFFKK